MTILPLQALVTETGAFQGSNVDVSGITGNWTVKLTVTALTAGAVARIAINDNPGGGTSYVVGPTFSFIGQVGPSYDNTRSQKQQDWPDLNVGVVNAKLNVQLVSLTAGASVSYHAWIEN